MTKSSHDAKNSDKKMIEHCVKHPFYTSKIFAITCCKIIKNTANQAIDFSYLAVNDAYEKITGRTREQTLGKRFSSIYEQDEETTARILATRLHVALTGQESQEDIFVQILDKWFSVYLYSPKRDYFVSVFKDITNQKRIEEEWIQFSNLSLDLFSIASFDGHLQRVNNAWTHCLGWSVAEITARPWLSFVHPEDQNITIEAGKELILNGKLREFENRYMCKDGTYRWLSWSSGTVNETRQMFSVTRDITEQKRAQLNLQKSNNQLRILAARLQTIREEQSLQIAREIHDILAQELTRIKIDGVWLAKRINNYLSEKAGDSTTVAMSQRVSDILKTTDIAISSVQKIATDLRPVILDKLGLHDAVEWLVEDFARRCNLKWRVSVSNSVDVKNLVEIDRDRSVALFRILQQCLTNVARHAKATAIKVKLDNSMKEVVLTVKDNGIGISDEKVNDIYSIGLVGIRERVLAFGGHTTIEGVPREDTTVTVRIPSSGGQ